jgi:DNA-binding beta-propeller fold protein YncE
MLNFVKITDMKNILVLLSLMFMQHSFGQTCQIIDSINTSPAGVYNGYFHPVGISFDGTGLWVAGSTIEANRIYKFDLSGNRVDSLDYDPNGETIEAIQYDNGYMWAVKFMQDTLYKIEIATGTVVDQYTFGMAPDVEENLDISMRGDTLYFVSGGSNINRFKFVKSTGTFISLGTGNYSPTGFEFWNDLLFATSWYPVWNQGCLMEPSTLLYNPSTPQPNWCVEKGLALTTDGTYFYQTSWDTKNIYILSMDNLGVNQKKIQTEIISPNPSNGHFMIQLSNPTSLYQIYSLTGELLQEGFLNQNDNDVEFNGPKGIFMLFLDNGNSRTTHKLVFN